jgi:hypothetical protein
VKDTSKDTYMELLKLVSPIIEKEDTIIRTATFLHEQLCITLGFLAIGRN